jgi:hypothetical protein
MSGDFTQPGKRAFDASEGQSRAKASLKRRKYSWQSR